MVTYWPVLLVAVVLIAWFTVRGAAKRILHGIDLRNIEEILWDVAMNGVLYVEKMQTPQKTDYGWVICINHPRLPHLMGILRRTPAINILLTWPLSDTRTKADKCRGIKDGYYPTVVGAGSRESEMSLATLSLQPLAAFRWVMEEPRSHRQLAIFVPWEMWPSDKFGGCEVEFEIPRFGWPTGLYKSTIRMIIPRQDPIKG